MARLFGRRPPEVPPAPPAAPARVERVVELPAPLKPLKPGGAVAAVMSAGEGFDPPYGGDSAGEMLAPPEPAPPSAPAHEFRVEPPPWADRLAAGDVGLDEFAPPERQPDELDALDKMKAAGGDIPEPRDWAPPVQTPKMPVVRVPPADWSAEQKQRAEQDPEPPAAPPGEPFIPPKPPWDPT